MLFPFLFLAKFSSHTALSSKYWNPFLSFLRYAHALDVLNFAQPCDSEGVQSVLERNQNTYESALICKMHMKRIPECTGDVCGRPLTEEVEEWDRLEMAPVLVGAFGHRPSLAVVETIIPACLLKAQI